MAKSQRVESWWIVDATETCPSCRQTYAYHTEVRCFDCDGPVCPICVQTTTTMTLSCPTCFECEDAESEGSN